MNYKILILNYFRQSDKSTITKLDTKKKYFNKQLVQSDGYSYNNDINNNRNKFYDTSLAVNKIVESNSINYKKNVKNNQYKYKNFNNKQQNQYYQFNKNQKYYSAVSNKSTVLQPLFSYNDKRYYNDKKRNKIKNYLTAVDSLTAQQKKKLISTALNTQKPNQYIYTKQSSSTVYSPLSGLSSAAAAAAAALTNGSRAILFKLVDIFFNASDKQQVLYNNKKINTIEQPANLKFSFISSPNLNYKSKNSSFKMGNLENLIRLV